MVTPLGAGGSRLDIEGTHNFREVAPGLLRPGQLYRSDALHRLTRAGRQALADLGIEVVVDLRSDLDRRFSGRDRLRGTGAEHLSVPVLGAPPRTDPQDIDLRWVYRTMLTRHRSEFGTVIRVIADSVGPVVVHCTAGKDRTGLVVALVLSALGVRDEAIAVDYAVSQVNLDGVWTERMLRKVRRFRVPVTDALLEILAHSPAPVLLETLDWLHHEHGGVLPYLATAGVDETVIARLQDRLLPRPPARPPGVPELQLP